MTQYATKAPRPAGDAAPPGAAADEPDEPSDPDRPDADPAAQAKAAAADAAGAFGEVTAYVGQYVSAWVDTLVATVRNAALWVALLAVVAILGVAALATAAVLLVVGLARLIGSLIHGTSQPWAGHLIVGGTVVLLATVGGYVLVKLLQSIFFRAAVRRYDRATMNQMMTTGHSAAERGADADGRPNPTRDPEFAKAMNGAREARDA